MSKLIGSYKNGNYTVSIYENGSKIRENDLDFFEAEFPESFDCKITNKCSGTNCKFCHEDSGPCGEHGDIMSPSFLDRLNAYTEIAIGGGDPLSHPDLIPFLEKCKSLKLIPSMTVNQVHFMKCFDLVKKLVDEKLIYGIGISLVDPNPEFISKVKMFPNAVIHCINGIVSENELKKLRFHNLKLLILGYKEVRRGKALYLNPEEKVIIDNKKQMFYDLLPKILKECWFNTVSFDNLALGQLDPKRLLTDDEWSEFYMGDDGIDGKVTSASMYADMAKREFAVNSCSSVRYPIMDDIKDMFKHLKDQYK